MLWFVFDLLFPRTSLSGSEGAIVTAAEFDRLLAAVHPVHIVLPSLDAVHAACDYRRAPLIRRAVHLFKYRRLPAIVAVLAAIMDRGLPPASQDAVLCPVPLHWSRRFWRGFNQAELLAIALGQVRTLPVQHLLRRRRATGTQARRGREDRLAAMRAAFCVPAGTVLPREVILVDDVVTTGATLSACATALRAAGVRRVSAWVIARA